MSNYQALPVGSVVRLAQIDAPIMVMGYEPMLDGESSDYMGVMYPVGLVTDESAIAFDGSAIEEVLFEGYTDKLREQTFESVTTYRDVTAEMLKRVEAFANSLTPDRVQELREEHAPVPMPDEFEIPEGFEDPKFE